MCGSGCHACRHAGSEPACRCRDRWRTPRSERQTHDVRADHQLSRWIDVECAAVDAMRVDMLDRNRLAAAGIDGEHRDLSGKPMMCAQTINFPVGSMWNVRQWMPCVSTCWIGTGLPLPGSMANTAI